MKGFIRQICEIIEEYKDGLVLYLNSFVGNIQTAEDLMEDVFVKLVIKKTHFWGKCSFVEYEECEQSAQENKEHLQEKKSDQERKENLQGESSQEESSSQKVEEYTTNIGNEESEAESSDPGTFVGTERPITDHPGNTGALTPYEEVWGGSYMDQDGRWVVLLTEDTPENRQAVFDLNPTLSEDRVIFKTANYFKAYLTELMVNISRAMGNASWPLTPSAVPSKSLFQTTVSIFSRKR